MQKVIIQCRDIAKERELFAKEKHLALEHCHVKLQAVSTYIKSVHMQHFSKFDESYKELYLNNHEALINDHISFKQIYKVTLFEESDPSIALKYKLEYQDYKSKALLHVEPSSTLKYSHFEPKEFYKRLLSEIYTIMAEHQILIQLFSPHLLEDIKAFVKKVYNEEFNKTFTLRLATTLSPNISKPSHIIYHFEHNRAKKQQYKEVEPNELLVEFTKPTFGSDGLNVFGRRIDSSTIDHNESLPFSYDKQSILVAEKEDSIRFFSSKKGYVHLFDNVLSVQNSIALKQINRYDDNLLKNEDNEVEVLLTQENIDIDSLNEGSELISERVHIKGFVGNHAKIEAKEVIIDGATHLGSTIYSKVATIHRHKGYLRCANAKIELLEGGELHATFADITAALGGNVAAQRVQIATLKSHSRVVASSQIIIDKIEGEDNHIIIDYTQVPIITDKIKFIQEDIELLRYSHKRAVVHDEIRAKGIMQKINRFKQEIIDIESSMFSAKITINAAIQGHNTITFVTPYGELNYATTQTHYSPFYLEERDDNIVLQPVNITLSK